MATIKYKGEAGGADEVVWKGKTLKKDEAVECDDEGMLEKASNNPYFEVSGYEKKSGEKETVPKVTQTSPMHPVAKPGEPKGK